MTTPRLPRRSAETYYKAVRPDGTDFYSGQVVWDQIGEIVEHPNPGSLGGDGAEGYLSVSVSPADCTGMRWPCRLLLVESVEGTPVWEPTPNLPSKRASHAWRVVRELPAYEVFGPNGAQVVAFRELLPTLTNAQWDAVRESTRDDAWAAAWATARNDAKIAAWTATRTAAWTEVWIIAVSAPWVAVDAARALVVRDLITAEQFDILTAPMRSAGVNFDTLTARDSVPSN